MITENPASVSFSELHSRVGQLVQRNADVTPTGERKAQWWLVGATAVGLLAGSVAREWLPPWLVSPLVQTAFLTQCGAAALYVFLVLRRELPNLRNAKRSHAKEMDVAFDDLSAVVDWLKQSPTAIREARLHFLTTQITRMNARLGLLLGGIERLGVMPWLIAFYLQMKDWHFGDWASLFDVSALAAVLILVILMLYLVGWFAVNLRLRLELYADLLSASLISNCETESVAPVRLGPSKRRRAS